MRVMIAVWPNPAHLYPVVPLARALQGAGHEVRIASHAQLAPATTAAGLTAVELGDPADPPMGPGRPQPREVTDRMLGLTEALDLPPGERDLWDVLYQFMLPSMWDFSPVGATAQDPHPVIDDAVRVARSWRPDLILWDPCFPAGGIAARASGATHARLLWGLDYFAWTMDRFAERPEIGDNPLVETVRPGAERHGVDVDEDLVLGSFTVDPSPSGIRLATSARTVPVRWVPFTGAGPVADWLIEPPSRPRVVVSLGLSQRMFFAGGWDHVPNLLTALGDLDVEVVATLDANQLAQVGELPANVRATDYVPLDQVLPTSSAIIHHGGVGTFSAACVFGVPQLVTDSDDDNGMITVEADGKEWSMATKHIESSVTAALVAERGAGAVLDIKALSVDEMRKRILDVLENPAAQDGADSLLDDLRATPAPNDAVRVLEALVAGRAS